MTDETRKSQGPSMSERKSILRATGVVSGATMLSRILGYVRDAVIAAYFGAGIYSDAFFAAFRIPNLLRRLFGEGALTISFIPVYSELKEKEGDERAKNLYYTCFTALISVLAVITILGILFAPFIARILVPGFADDLAKQDITILLLKIMFPYALLICTVALFMGVLNSWNRFFAPAFAPVLLNVGMITATVLLVNQLELPVMALAIGVVAGGIMQVALQMPFLKKIGHLPKLRFQFRDPALKKIGRLMLPSLLGLSVYSLNVFINTNFASLLAPGSVSFLFYADRLMELPQGVFAIAVGAALLPSLSRQAASGDASGLVDSMNYAMRLVIIIILPASVGLYVLAEPIINVLFQRGRFDFHSTVQTAAALRFYIIGLVFFAALRVIVPTFYAMKDAMTPALVGAGALVVNILCGLSFMGPTVSNALPFVSAFTEAFNPTGPLRHTGLALANTFSGGFNFFVLAWILKKRIGKIGLKRILRTFGLSGLSALLMGLVAWMISGCFQYTSSNAELAKTSGLAAAVVAGAAVYFALMMIMNRSEMREIFEFRKKRRR
jgi:putative peptidoglycan lipid II flippase